jgi:hypothetical protein
MNRELRTCRCKGIIARGKRKGKRCGRTIIYNTRYRPEPPQLCGSCDNLANETNYNLQRELDILEERCERSNLNFATYKEYFLKQHGYKFEKKSHPHLTPADLFDLGEYPHRLN